MGNRRLIENPSRGKLEMLIGGLGMIGGLVTGVGGCMDTLSKGHAEDCANYLMAGGAIIGVSGIVYLVGKFKHWYHND